MRKFIGPNGEKMTEMELHEIPPMTAEEAAQLDAIRDENIDFSDIPDMSEDDDFWENATIGWPPPGKTHLTLRLDNDIVHFFKRRGRGYQSRMNAVLRSYMQAQLRAEAKTKEKPVVDK